MARRLQYYDFDEVHAGRMVGFQVGRQWNWGWSTVVYWVQGRTTDVYGFLMWLIVDWDQNHTAERRFGFVAP